MPPSPEPGTEPWPALPLDAWSDTCATLHQVARVQVAAGVDPVAGRRRTAPDEPAPPDADLFDVEAVFLYPWAVILRELKMFGFWEMLVYIGIVLVGLFYVWNKGVLDWSGAERVAPSGGTPALMAEPVELVGAAPSKGTRP